MPNVTIKSIVARLSKVKLDSVWSRRHTQTTMNRTALAFEHRMPLPAQLLTLGLVILTVIVILPR
jgi:hypothetical protein